MAPSFLSFDPFFLFSPCAQDSLFGNWSWWRGQTWIFSLVPMGLGVVKNCLCVFWAHFLVGKRKSAQAKSPENPWAIPGILFMCFLFLFFSRSPNKTRTILQLPKNQEKGKEDHRKCSIVRHWANGGLGSFLCMESIDGQFFPSSTAN